MYLTAESAHDRRKEAQGTKLSNWLAIMCTIAITLCTTEAFTRDLRGEAGGDNSNSSGKFDTLEKQAARTEPHRTEPT